MMLMFLGIGFLSLLTASIASRFVKEERGEEHARGARSAAADRGGRRGVEGPTSQVSASHTVSRCGSPTSPSVSASGVAVRAYLTGDEGEVDGRSRTRRATRRS